MQYRRFGQTNLFVSVFTLGTMRCLASADTARQTLERAVALGINQIETAQAYGQSERYLGQAIQSHPQSHKQTESDSALIVMTKITPKPDADSMAQAIEQSLARLQLESVDCLAIHGLNTPEHLSWVQQPDGCMHAVRQAVESGKIRHVGFSTHGALEVILGAIQTQAFAFVNLHYSLFFQRNAPAIALAQQEEMGIFIISPADKGGQLYTPPQALQALCAPFDPLHLNARFLLSQPAISTLSVGAATPAELDWPLAVADQTHPLTPLEQERIQQLQRHQQEILNAEQCHQCFACLPCPEAIHIPEVLRLRNLAVAYDMVDFGRYRYRMFENAGHWFPGRKANRCTECGDCLPRCPAHLNIPELLLDTHERLGESSRPRLWESL